MKSHEEQVNLEQKQVVQVRRKLNACAADILDDYQKEGGVGKNVMILALLSIVCEFVMFGHKHTDDNQDTILTAMEDASKFFAGVEKMLE